MAPQATLITEIEHAIANGTAQRRAEMLMHITDLFVRDSVAYSEEEIDLFDGVITRLAAEIEVSVRVLLAQRLAPIATSPFNITRILAGDDEISVASPILTQSLRLDDTTLVQTARSKSQAHLLAISRRNSLSELVTDVLVERGNNEVVLSTAKNFGAWFSKAGFNRLVKRADGNEALAVCFGSRPDIPHSVLLVLLATASELVKVKLIAENPNLRQRIHRAVEMVTDDLRNDVNARSLSYADAEALVKSLNTSGQLGDETIRTFAEERKLEEATAALSRVCNVSIGVVEQAMTQSKPEMMLILAKAAKLSWPTTKALLSLRSCQSISTREVEQSLASFERLNVSTAQKIIEFYKLRGATESCRAS